MFAAPISWNTYHLQYSSNDGLLSSVWKKSILTRYPLTTTTSIRTRVANKITEEKNRPMFKILILKSCFHHLFSFEYIHGKQANLFLMEYTFFQILNEEFEVELPFATHHDVVFIRKSSFYFVFSWSRFSTQEGFGQPSSLYVDPSRTMTNYY
jgi:hypothetical protein